MCMFELPGFLSKGYTTIYGFLVSSFFSLPPLPIHVTIICPYWPAQSSPNRGKLSHCYPYITDNRAKKTAPCPGGRTNQQLPVIIIPTLIVSNDREWALIACKSAFIRAHSRPLAPLAP